MTINEDDRNERMTKAAGRLAIGLWVALSVVIVFKTLQHPENHSTYPLFHDAAVAWWNGVDVYDRDVFGGDYRYGPSFAMVLGPIAWLPYRAGAVLWALMNVGIAFWAIKALSRRVLPGMQSPLARSLLLIFALFPSVHCLYSSQTNLLVFSLVVFAAIAVLDKRWWLAALLLAIPIHIKIWPLAGALLLTACWPRRLAWRLPLALAAVAALPLLAKPPAWVWEQYSHWYRHLVGPAQVPHSYRDAWTIWELISSPVNPRLYTVAAIGDCRRGAGPLPVAIATNVPATHGFVCPGLLDLMAACLWPGNRTEHFRPDRPPYELGFGHCRVRKKVALVDGVQLSAHDSRRDGGGRGHLSVAQDPAPCGNNVVFRMVLEVELAGSRPAWRNRSKVRRTAAASQLSWFFAHRILMRLGKAEA